MSCYFRYLHAESSEAGIRVTPANKRALEQAIHRHVGVPYKRCMPDCWWKVKALVKDPVKRAALITVLKNKFSSSS